ncbi:MAG TPA: hypothetical protein VIY27_07860 [Myxococcota bacterium]
MSGLEVTPRGVLAAIGALYESELVDCTDERDRWLAMGNHVRETLRENERLKRRNAYLEEKLSSIRELAGTEPVPEAGT